MDFNDICDGLAARYAPGTIGTPTGASAMRGAYGQEPNGAKPTPFVVVHPQDGEVTFDPGILRGEHNLDVDFYLSKASADFKRIETERQLWLPLLLTATTGQVKLNLAPIVMKALPVGWEYDQLPYGGETYDGITIHYRVWTEEAVTLTP